MNDEVLAEALRIVYVKQFSQFDNPPKHKLPLRHKIAVRRILRDYEKKCAKLYPKPKLKFKFTRKTVVFIALIIFLAVACGFTMVYFISRNFRGEMHSEYTELFPIDGNGPATIENVYYLSELPEGFELTQHDESPYYEYNVYDNKSTHQAIDIRQYTKSLFRSTHLNTEKGKLEEVDVNGYYGVLLDTSGDSRSCVVLIWDNGDYILEISADLAKSEVINLAKSAKIKEN